MGTKEQYERRKAEDRRRNENAEPRKGFGKRSWRHPDHVARFTFWVATFTFLLAGIGLIQVWAFIQSERAFLSIDDILFTPSGPTDRRAIFTIRVKNSGRSTANVKHNVYRVNLELPSTPDYYVTMREVTLAPVVGNGTARYDARIDVTPDHAAEFVAALDGNSLFYFYGLIEYEDEFSLIGFKKLGWCFRYDTESRNFRSCNNAIYTYSR
jgi:hypothetical protein